ncbi:HAD family hydrolase [Candidatus Pelagibacter sp. HIMB1587]|uniref:HAD family hydrolase n=1 Tax=Candidatus Pelagibacter sp. HIMB1587 TaxID=3413354 RepID=UPI003F82741D
MIIVFDLDDTLYDERQFFSNGVMAVSNYLIKNYNFEKNIYRTIISREKLFGREKLFDFFLKKKKIFSKSLLKKLIYIYRYNDYRLSLYQDTIRCLEKLKHFRKYVLTDGNKHVQETKIKKLKINNYFQNFFITRRYGIKSEKPSLNCFKKIINKENIKWDQMIYVGDNPKKDFVNLNKKGSITIRILRGNFKNLKVNKNYNAKYFIKNLDRDLIKLINRIR